MGKGIFTIGEVSRLKDMTIKALRFYDRIGLLRPYRVDPSSRYRYYHISQFVYLDIIKAARTLDISPKDLIPYFKDKDTDGVLRFLDGHKEEARLKIKCLEDTIAGIDQINASICNSRAAQKEGGIYTKRIQDRHTVAIPYIENKTEEEYVLDFSKLDAIVNRLGLFNTYEFGVLFAAKGHREFAPEYLFTTVLGASDDNHYRLIPGGEYICVCYNKDTALQQQRKLQKHLLRHNLAPIDLVQVELLSDIFDDKPGFFELEVRIGD